MKSKLVVQQTAIEPHYQHWLLRYANDKNILIKDLWILAINNLFKKRLAWKKQKSIPMYIARTRTKVVPFSVQLPENVVEQVKAACQEDLSSVRAFYYTALIDFINSRKGDRNSPKFVPLRKTV